MWRLFPDDSLAVPQTNPYLPAHQTVTPGDSLLRPFWGARGALDVLEEVTAKGWKSDWVLCYCVRNAKVFPKDFFEC